MVNQPRGLGPGREPAQTEREPTRVGKEPTCARKKSTYVWKGNPHTEKAVVRYLNFKKFGFQSGPHSSFYKARF